MAKSTLLAKVLIIATTLLPFSSAVAQVDSRFMHVKPNTVPHTVVVAGVKRKFSPVFIRIIGLLKLGEFPDIYVINVDGKKRYFLSNLREINYITTDVHDYSTKRKVRVIRYTKDACRRWMGEHSVTSAGLPLRQPNGTYHCYAEGYFTFLGSSY